MQKLVLEIVKVIWGNGWSKTGSFLAVTGATSLLGWVAQFIGSLFDVPVPQPPEWASLLVMFSGIGLLVWGNRHPSTTPAANPHDEELMRSFRQLITEQVLDFLRNHNFGTPWRRSLLDPLATFAETWRGARYEFQDPDLNAALTAAKNSANDLEELITVGSWPDHHNAQIQTVKTDEDRQRGTQQGTLNKIREMNNGASQLVRTIDDLERLARGKRL